MLGQPINTYDGLDADPRVRAREVGRASPNVDPPSTEADLDEAAARYGVAFLAVRRIAEKYGQDKMLDFWGRVVHDNTTARRRVAQPALGATVGDGLGRLRHRTCRRSVG